jgi:hypothetical protein
MKSEFHWCHNIQHNDIRHNWLIGDTPHNYNQHIVTVRIECHFV